MLTAMTTASSSTRERILDAAISLFAEQGYESTSTAQIENAVGLSPRSGAMYKHFRSKQELLEAALAPRLEAISELSDRVELGPLSDLRSELLVLARWTLAELEKERNLSLILMKDGARIPGFREAFRDAIVRPGHAISTEVLRRYSASHEVEFSDVDALGSVLCSALVGFMLQRFLMGPDFVDVDEDRYAEAFVEASVALVEQNERRRK